MKLALFAILALAAGPVLAAFSIMSLVDIIIWLLIAGVIYWLGLWLVGQVGPPEPFNKIIRIILAVIVFVIVLNALLSLVGGSFISFR
jgi:membrane protein insertase Oxa1/YidC/SpoIIIJ